MDLHKGADSRDARGIERKRSVCKLELEERARLPDQSTSISKFFPTFCNTSAMPVQP
jgi:hypothetical protein